MSARPKARRRLGVKGKLSLGALVACLLVGFVGPWLAPFKPTAIQGLAYQGSSREFVLGLDYLGRDVLSRLLSGGRTALTLSAAAVAVGYVLGLMIGLTSAYLGGIGDQIMMRAVDVVLAFPGLIFILLFVTALGSSKMLLVLAVGLSAGPRIARIVRGAALEVMDLPFVEAARARGESPIYIATREVLPNILSSISVDFGIRLATTILLVAGVSFLGFGLQPPVADWGLMVSENRAGITVQPWPVVAPAAMVGILTLSINLLIDDWRAGATGRVGVAALAER